MKQETKTNNTCYLDQKKPQYLAKTRPPIKEPIKNCQDIVLKETNTNINEAYKPNSQHQFLILGPFKKPLSYIPLKHCQPKIHNTPAQANPLIQNLTHSHTQNLAMELSDDDFIEQFAALSSEPTQTDCISLAQHGAKNQE